MLDPSDPTFQKARERSRCFTNITEHVFLKHHQLHFLNSLLKNLILNSITWYSIWTTYRKLILDPPWPSNFGWIDPGILRYLRHNHSGSTRPHGEDKGLLLAGNFSNPHGAHFLGISWYFMGFFTDLPKKSWGKLGFNYQALGDSGKLPN